MRFDNVKRISQDNARRVYHSLKLINRHALILVPLLALTFAIIAGWIASEYGAHYLFRDNEQLSYLGIFPNILQSARFHTALYATALMGMVWTLFVLIENWDDNPDNFHPVGKVNAVLPGVFLLGLVMVVANLINWGDTERFVAVLALTMLGYGAGLGVVAIVTKLGLLLSQRIKTHQLWTFLGLSILLAAMVAVSPVITPSKAILIVLATLVVVYCAFEIAKVHYRFPLALAIFLLFLVGSILPSFKYEFEGLEDYYRPASSEGAIAAPLIEPKQSLEAWLAHQPADSRKLVIVAASGGAYRATFWTAIVLDELSQLKGFDHAVRLMTGASGGMVAEAYFAATRQPPPGLESRGGQSCRGASPSAGLSSIKGPPTIQDRLSDDLRAQRKGFWLANSQTDSLTPVVQRLIGFDMPLAFFPITNWWDRGRVLEAGWQTLQPTFCDLAAGEREGWRPSLVVSPYLVDGAKQMFISNLDLQHSVKSEFGMEFFQAFPKAYPTFKLATAVRMSATFPFISPAVRLPLPGRPRVVDAGYFDNFGITAAAMFLRSKDVRDFVKANKVHVVLIRILAWRPEDESDADGLWQRFTQVTDAVTSPLEGALAARETRGKFANALLLEDLERIYEGHFDKFDFANPVPASYSWHIQTNDLEKMKQAMGDASNQKELARLSKIWTRQGGSPTSRTP